MTMSPFQVALLQLCDEKGLPKDIVIQSVEAALAAAYRKEYREPQEIIRAKLNENNLAQSDIYQVFNVVEDEEFKDEFSQMKIRDAKKHKKNAKIGDEILIKLEPKSDFGRIAAQTAKQVIIQRLQEAERNIIFDEYKNKEGQLLNGTVQQMEGGNIIVNLGKTNAIMPISEQVRNEKYYVGQRLKVYLVSVEKSPKGARILVSRSHPNLIIGLFTLEVPEIASGSVKINGVAREAGSRTKIAVATAQEGLDPVGSCVGQRGIRVQAVLAEIGDEKIDIILWDSDQEKYINNALSPAKVSKIKLNKKNKKATVYVVAEQLSLAIGKNGQNVRLASKITEWGIDIERFEEKENKQKDKKNIETKPADSKKIEVMGALVKPTSAKKVKNKKKLKKLKSDNKKS